jgi:hypothetical protein
VHIPVLESSMRMGRLSLTFRANAGRFQSALGVHRYGLSVIITWIHGGTEIIDVVLYLSGLLRGTLYLALACHADIAEGQIVISIALHRDGVSGKTIVP